MVREFDHNIGQLVKPGPHRFIQADTSMRKGAIVYDKSNVACAKIIVYTSSSHSYLDIQGIVTIHEKWITSLHPGD